MASGHWETRRAVVGEDANGNPIVRTEQVWVPDPAPAPAAKTVAPKATAGAKAAVPSYEQQEAARLLAQKRAAATEAARRRLAESQLMLRRREAYAALQRRSRVLLSEDQTAAQVAQERVRLQTASEEAATRLAQRAEQTRRVGGVTVTEDETESQASSRRRQQIANARRTGNYVAILDYVEAQQKATGGRYVDRELLDAAMRDFALIRDKARATFEPYLDQFNQLQEAGDYTRLVALYNSAEFQSAMEEYVRVYGDGRAPGVAQQFAEAQNRIAAANDEYLERSILGARFYGRVLTAEELRQRREELTEELLVRQGSAKGGVSMYAEDQYRISMSQFLRESELAERERMQAQYGRYQNAIRLARQEGLLTPEGEISNVTQETVQFRDQLLDLWKGAGMSQGDVQSLIDQLGGSIQVDRERALRELYQTALRAWERRNGPLFSRNIAGEQNRRTRTMYTAARQQFIGDLWRFLTGSRKPGGLEGSLTEFGMDPIGSGLISALSLPVGLVGAGIRSLTSAISGGGQLRTPDIHFFNPNEPFFQLQDAAGRALQGFQVGGFTTPFFGLDTSAQTRAQSRSDINELERVFAGGDFGRSAEALLGYGTNWAGGNTAGLISTAFDPLSYFGVSQFLRGGRLALARAGGLRAALRSPLLTSEDFLRLSLPEVLGGFDRSMVRELLDRAALSRELKLPYQRIAGMTDDEVRELAATAIGRTAEELKRMPAWVRAFREDPVNTQQLMNAALRAAQEAAGDVGSRVVMAADLEKRVRLAEDALARAEREAAAETRRAAEVAETAAQAKALESVRKEIARIAEKRGPKRKPIRVVVAGGRAYRDGATVDAVLNVVQERLGVSAVIHGGARGADDLGGAWARRAGVPEEVVSAEWDRLGKVAGFARNERMLRESKPDLVLVFPGGAGTQHTVAVARTLGLRVKVLDERMLPTGKPSTRAGVYEKLHYHRAKASEAQVRVTPAMRAALGDRLDGMSLLEAARLVGTAMRSPDLSAALRGTYEDILEQLVDALRLQTPTRRVARVITDSRRRGSGPQTPAVSARSVGAPGRRVVRIKGEEPGRAIEEPLGVSPSRARSLAIRFLKADIAESYRLREGLPDLLKGLDAEGLGRLLEDVAPLPPTRRPPVHEPVRQAGGSGPVRVEQRRLERLLGQAEVQRLRVSRDAGRAAEVLRTSRDPVLRRQASADLSRLLGELRAIEGPGGGKPGGLLSRRRAELERFLDQHGLSREPPRFLGVSQLGVATDRRFIRNAMRTAQQRLAGDLSASQRVWWERRLNRLRQAEGYLDLEDRLLAGASRVSSQALGRFVDDVRDVFSLNQVTGRALTHAGGREELARDIHRLLGRVEAEAPVSADARRQVAGAVVGMQRRKFVPTAEVKAEVGDLLDDVDMWTAVRVARDVSRGVMVYDELMKEVMRQVRPVLQESGFRAFTRDMDRFWRLVDLGSGTGPAKGIREYRALDAAVQKAIQEARQFTARGQLRAGRLGPGGRRRIASVPDTDPRVVLAKVQALDKAGVGLRQYEELRGLFRNPNLRFNRGVSLRSEARKTARSTGVSEAEAFDAARERVRDAEAVRALESFAAENPNLTAGELVSRFQEEFIRRDLVPLEAQTVSEFGLASLQKAWHEVSRGVDLADEDAVRGFLTRHNAPPLGNRRDMRKWLVENGQWAPRTADDIRAGQRVWSVADQRAYWEGAYGYTPPWTDPNELAAILDDSELYRAKFEEWGFFDEDFDRLITATGVEPKEVAGEIVWGGEGIARARTYDELRQWAIDTYGDLVSPDGQTLTAMPWLMDPRAPEYRAWIGKMLAAGAEEPAVRLRSVPLEIDRTLIREGQIKALETAVFNATQRRIKRLVRAGEVAAGEEWLPQEQLLFAYEVVNELLLHPRWRSWLQRSPAGRRVLGGIGAFFRIPMTWTLAFPLMNLIDSFGLKRGLLAMVENGGRPLSLVRAETRRAVPDLQTIGADRMATWYLKGENGFRVMADSALDRELRARGFLKGLTEAPLRLSKWGEDHLRLDFGRAVYQRSLDDLLAAGVAPDAAHVRSLAEARRMIAHYFPSLETAGEFEKAFNQVVPFFSYNVKNKLISLQLGLTNPWVILVADRLGDFVEEQNRARWEAEHPGVPFPIDGRERQIQVRIGDTEYTIDLSTYSDWSRGMELLFKGHTPEEWLYEFFRVPHPSQAIFLAWAFGFNDGKTWWGTDVRFEDLSVWTELIAHMMKDPNAFDPNDPRAKDNVQILSQLLFFKGFGRLSPIRAKVQIFFGLMELDEDKAWDYYRDNPDLRAYFMLDGTDYRPSLDLSPRLPSWFRHRSQEEITTFEAAQAEYERIKAGFDALLDQYYLRPWDPAYRALVRQRRETLALFLRANPILADVWGFYRTREEWATEFDSWKTDELVDAYFALDARQPKQGDYDSEVAYLKALDAFYDMKRLFLESHPDVYDRLHFSHNAVERAWFDHELMWAETLDRIASIRIKIAEEESRPEPNRELISLLYDLAEANYLKLNAESFGEFYDQVDAFIGGDGPLPRFELPSLGSAALGRIKQLVTFPGRADFLFERGGPAERQRIEADERYVKDIKAFVEGLRDSRFFWTELAKRPQLLEEYLTRNPERRDDYRYSVGIGNIVRQAKSGRDFFRLLEQDPWLMAEYFRRHPDKAASYQAGREYFSWISRWIEKIKAGDSVGAQKVWDSMPSWVHDRYFAKHPESGMASVDGVSYFSSIGRWVELLRAKKYDEADAYFRALPDWVRERYFSKHPDQRAKHELESSVLRAGAEYFLASAGDKAAVLERYPQLAAWLNRYGGNEAAMRGLIFAIYRAIPSSEAWLKRTFRERFPEHFGVEAQGQRRLRKVADMLVRNPEMKPFYERALALNSAAFEAQLRRGGTPPKPLTVERRRRLAARRRKRRSRFSSHWSLHKDLRG